MKVGFWVTLNDLSGSSPALFVDPELAKSMTVVETETKISNVDFQVTRMTSIDDDEKVSAVDVEKANAVDVEKANAVDGAQMSDGGAHAKMSAVLDEKRLVVLEKYWQNES